MPIPLTLPSIEDFLDSHLGISLDSNGNIIKGSRIHSSRPISFHLAELILALCENKHTCYIEFPPAYSIQRDPVIWSWKDWIDSQERHERRKAQAHKDRIERFLYEDNVELVTKGLVKEMGFDEDKARAMAFRAVRTNNKGLLFVSKVEKLKTKEEEL